MWEDLLFVGILGVLGVAAQLDWVKKWKYNWALEIIRLAVAWTYENLVRQQKSDGDKLTEEQRQQARLTAIKKAYDMAETKGLDLDEILGTNLLEMFVEVAVSKAKGAK